MVVSGTLILSQGIYCQCEVLGMITKAMIAGINVNVYFPQYSSKNSFTADEVGNPLLAPDIVRDLGGSDNKRKWGYICSFPNKDVYISQLALSFECAEAQVNENAQILYGAIDKWETAFLRYCILSRGYFSCSEIKAVKNTFLELFGTSGYIPAVRTIKLSGFLVEHSSCMPPTLIEDAIAFASSGKDLLLEYQMMLAAYEAKAHGRNRQAIIDACSAIELCFVNKITAYCKAHNIPPDILLGKYRSLGERLALIKKIDKSFCTEGIKENVIHARNNVAHNNNIFPSNEETVTLLKAVDSYLRTYYSDFYEK